MLRTSAGTFGIEPNALHPLFLVLVVSNLFHCKAALGGNLLKRQSALGVVVEVFARGVYRLDVRFIQSVVLVFGLSWLSN